MEKRSRGRPANADRAAARQRGDKRYLDPSPCEVCGDQEKYVANGACVSCAIAAGKLRYASFTLRQKVEQKDRDRARYLKRLTESVESK